MFDKNNVDSGTKTTEIIREVQTVKTGETQVIKEEANPLIFVLVGVGITLVAVAVAFATAYCVLKKRRQNEKIVVFDESGAPHGIYPVNQTEARGSMPGFGSSVLYGEPVDGRPVEATTF